MFDYLLKQTNLYKKLYQFWYGPFVPAVQLVHPDSAKVIFKSSEPKYTNKDSGTVYTYLIDWLGLYDVGTLTPEKTLAKFNKQNTLCKHYRNSHTMLFDCQEDFIRIIFIMMFL